MTDSNFQEARKNSRIILWFRDDLRLHDNPTVHAAVTRVRSKQASEVGVHSRILLDSTAKKHDNIQQSMCDTKATIQSPL